MEYYFLERPIHLNRFNDQVFNLKAEENKYILSHLDMSIDGTILGVDKEKVNHLFQDPDVRAIRYGLVKMPKSFEFKNEEDFFKIMAVMISLSDA